MQSPFLDRPVTDHVAANELAFAIRDLYPVTPGHTLVIPRRLVANWFEATPAEHAAIMDLVVEVKRQLDAELRPDGYNVGFNAGEAAGQTVMHLHVHVIPRFRGDMDDPRGGVRHVIPSKGNYRAQSWPLTAGGEQDPFAHHVLPLLERARSVCILAAFVQESGLRRIRQSLDAALRTGARVRLLTGDYLNITQASALEMLLDWLANWPEADDEEAVRRGVLEARIVEVERLPGRTRSFHPKSWHLEGSDFGVAFVGSSNLSVAALDTGIEWNLRVDRDRDRPAWERIRAAYDDLWVRGRPLDREWVEAYGQRVRERPLPMPPGESEEEEVPSEPPEPHAVQEEALAAMARNRREGHRRALVVLATGLGKTWLAAFDWQQAWDELGRPPRLLFIAHRREILLQAAETYRQVIRQRGVPVRIGRLAEDKRELDAHLVFASVSKLARNPWLDRLAEQKFDYVVIDEVHHAAADSYRRILAAIDPPFLLGLTATPDRADDADVVGLFDDNLAFSAGIERGIAIQRLVPFRYYGLKDDVDYSAGSIPWRNGRFDPERLAEAVQTGQRMESMWKAWQEHAGTRTLVFCCSVAHADFTSEWLVGHGVRVAKVYSASGSDDRSHSLQRLAKGEIDAICAIDVFNEGVDVPAIDRVVMLRPTESGVVFLQQLGRGLRSAPGKPYLTVIDFVGNHRVFLERLRTLVSLGATRASEVLRQLVEKGEVGLPAGCAISIELEAKHLLEALFRVGGADEVERVYRELRVARGERPKAGELHRMGYLPSALRRRHGSWFGWVQSEGDLGADETAAFTRAKAFLTDLEVNERMNRSYKMVTLEALVEAEALAFGFPVRDLALRAWQILRRTPDLLAEVPEDVRLPAEPTEADIRRWVAYWRENPIEAWTAERRNQRTWFHLDADKLVINLDVDAAMVRLVRELVDYRLAAYRSRTMSVDAETFECSVTWNKRDPILKLPDRSRQKIPDGEVDVRLPDGSVWLFRFRKEFCNVARPAGADRNQLPDLLRGWFGPIAGQPGTAFDVRFSASPDGLWVEPVQSQGTVALPTRRGLVAYPDLRAAAGHAIEGTGVAAGERVWLPFEGDDEGVFAVRVAGNSMDGGNEPLRDGDWAVFRLCRGASVESLVGRVGLVQVPSASIDDRSRFQIKRIARDDGGFRLVSDSPDGPAFVATADAVVVARLERSLHPEDLAPAVGAKLSADGLAAAFGLPGLELKTGRQGGHLFLVLGDRVALSRPDRVTTSVERMPGEVGHVLGRADGGVRFLGVARWIDPEEGWELPEQPFDVWREFGDGRTVSRVLPPEALARASRVVEAVMGLAAGERLLVQPSGAKARVLGKAPRGGLRIAVGEGERTVSLGDIGWVAVAADDVREQGGLLDEARVNRARYLEGTPKGSTRWIDTGWALASWWLGADRAGVVLGVAVAQKPRRADGTEVDATYRVELLEVKPTIVIEARGGTRGTPAALNTEYSEGLQLLLERLKKAQLTILDAAVETRDTRDLPIEVRRLDLGAPYPVEVTDPDALRRAIGRAQERVGRKPGATGGNSTRRIRIWVGGEVGETGALQQVLQGP